MMMALGMFVFSLPTLAYQALRRQTTWRHASNARIGAAPAYQFVGQGDDTITLSGWFAPAFMGSGGALTLLRRMGDTGRAYMLVDGSGTVHGAYILENLDEEQTLLDITGQAQRYDFTLTLKRVSDEHARTLLNDLQLPLSTLDGSILDWGL